MAMRSCRGGWRVRRPPQSSSSPAGPDPKRPRSFFPVIRSRGNPVIRNAVRIGREAVVMPRVTIGDGAIIAARARSRPGCRPVPRSEAILPGLEEAVQRRGRRPVAAPRGGCALRSKDAPNILYGPLGIMIPYRRTSIQNGGSARGYQELFASLACWLQGRPRLQSRWPGHQGRILYTAALIANVLICRDDAGPPHAKRRGLVVDAAATFPAGDELCGFAALMATMIRSGR